MKNSHYLKILLVASAFAAPAFGQGILEDYDPTAGFWTEVGADTYTTGDFDTDGDNELKADIATGGFKQVLRKSLQSADRANDPLLLEINATGIFAFDYENASATDGVTMGLYIASDLPVTGFVTVDSIFVAPSASGTFSVNLLENTVWQDAITEWLTGAGSFLQIRILQTTTSGTASSMIYDDFRLITPPAPGTLEDYDTLFGYFQQNWNPNATYAEGDFNTDGDNELKIDIPAGGYQMGLRRAFQASDRANDPFLLAIQANPYFSYEYENLSGTEDVTIAVVLRTNWLANDQVFGQITVPAGGSGTLGVDLLSDSTVAGSGLSFSDVIDQWVTGSGSSLQFRLLQFGPSGVLSSMLYDNLRLSEVPPTVLENYDDIDNYFQRAWNGNATVTGPADLDSDGDNEIQVEFGDTTSGSNGFNMALRRVFQGTNRDTDPFIVALQAEPVFSFDYENNGSSPIILGVVLASTDGSFGAWQAFGTISVDPGESGTYAFNVFSDPLFASIIDDWINGSWISLQFRILQGSEDGSTGSSLIYDNIELAESTVSVVVPTVTVAPNGTDLDLTFQTELNLLYQIQSSTDLSGGSWTDVGAGIPGSGTEITITVPGTAGDKVFYRVEVTSAG